ncbi:MAG: hypothetical protein WA945_02045, partial [Arcobacteraceae bacterium]
MKSNILNRASILIAVIILFGGCTSNKVDVLSFPTKIKSKVIIPEVCLSQYKSALPSVAVVDFTNNSTFGKAQINDTNSKSVGNINTVGVSAPIGFVRGSVSASSVIQNSKKSSAQR